jgi:anti-sigma regulatory factor (Ser/Thr protein kinase)
VTEAIDSVTLTVPNRRSYFAVPRLLVGGVAVRLSLPYEQLDDLQLAVETILLHDLAAADEVTLELAVDGRDISIQIGPVDARALQGEPTDPEEGLGLGRLLSTLLDRVDVFNRGGQQWLRLEKRLPGSGDLET